MKLGRLEFCLYEGNAGSDRLFTLRFLERRQAEDFSP